MERLKSRTVSKLTETKKQYMNSMRLGRSCLVRVGVSKCAMVIKWYKYLCVELVLDVHFRDTKVGRRSVNIATKSRARISFCT